jgi:hypothetical protein
MVQSTDLNTFIFFQVEDENFLVGRILADQRVVAGAPLKQRVWSSRKFRLFLPEIKVTEVINMEPIL